MEVSLRLLIQWYGITACVRQEGGTLLSSMVQATWLMEGLGGARRRLRAAAAASSSMGQDSTSEDVHMLARARPRLCRLHTCSAHARA